MINEFIDVNKSVGNGDVLLFLIKSVKNPTNKLIKQLSELKFNSAGKIIVVIGSGFNDDELTKAVQVIHLHEKKVALAWDGYPENHIEKILQKVKEMN